MNEKFYIRTIALFLLEKIYLKSGYDFESTINVNELLDDDIDIDMIQKVAFYLKEKNFITYDTVPYKDNNWSVSITATGIDWVEECHNINPIQS